VTAKIWASGSILRAARQTASEKLVTLALIFALAGQFILLLVSLPLFNN
jgi:hypothetical protein